MRKRSEVAPAQEEKPGAQGAKLDIEDDPSAMSIELKKRGYDVGPSTVKNWAPGPKHLVAIWLNGDLSEEDIPEAIKGLKKLPSPEEVVSSVVAGSGRIFEELAKEKTSPKPRTQRESLTQPGSEMEPTRRAVSIPGKIDSVENAAGEFLLMASPPDTLTVTWGEEVFYPVKENYSKFAVGMLSTTVHLKPGEDKVARMRAEYSKLEGIAEELREQKRVSFLRALKGVRDEPKT